MTNRVDRAELGRIAGVSPGKGELVALNDLASHATTWYRRYAYWSKLGPTATGAANPIEHKSEDHRVFAFLRVGGCLALVGAAAVLASLFVPVPQMLAVPGVSLAVIATALIGYHFYLAASDLGDRRPPLPVFVTLPPKGTQAHQLIEAIETELMPTAKGSGIVLEEKVTRADGQLDIFVRQRDTAADVQRMGHYAKRFRGYRPTDISLGFVALDRPPVATWELPSDRKGASAGLAKASPRVLELKSPVLEAEHAKLFPSASPQSVPWSYSAQFSVDEPLARCPVISAAAMIEPTSAGNIMRLTMSRSVDDRSPDTRVRFAGISGQTKIATGGAFRRPSVELYRGPRHGSASGPTTPSTEDNPQTHAPDFALSFSDNDEFLPGDSLTVYLTFERPIQPHEQDAIWFLAQFDFLESICGFHQLALFDPLGRPVSERETSTAGSGSRPVFSEPSVRYSTMVVRGGLSLSRLQVTSEDTTKATLMHPGRLPDASLVHELISSFVSDHRLALRDVREDFAERSAADRGALVWTILAKDSENLLSPDLTMRVSGARTPATGQEATSVEISVIAKFLNEKDQKSLQQLKAAIATSADQIVKDYVARRSPDDARGAVGAASSLAHPAAMSGNASDRLERVVQRAEAIIARFERLFRPS